MITQDNSKDALYLQSLIEFKEIERLKTSVPNFRPTELQKKTIERFRRLQDIQERRKKRLEARAPQHQPKYCSALTTPTSSSR